MKRWVLSISLILIFSCRPDHPSDSSLQKKESGDKSVTGSSSVQKSSLYPTADLTPAREKQVLREKQTARKKRPVRNSTMPEAHSKNGSRSNDSLFLQKLRYLQAHHLEIDLNEPKSKEYLASPGVTDFESMITLSHERFLQINFDNDILDNTDRFYTNGIRFDFISPALKQFPLSWLMVPYWGTGTNYYGISLIQNMYTPSTTKAGGILTGDRPYSAYLLLGSFKITNDRVKKFRQKSEFDIGVIGPFSFGDFVQKSFHNSVPTNNEPLGWEYQVQDDLVLNYEVSFEKGLVSLRNFELNVNAGGMLGTLYTNLNGGFLMRTGVLNPYFVNLGVAKRSLNREAGLRNTQIIFFMKANSRFVGYDATLQGGVFNNSSMYTLSSGLVSRYVFEGSAGLTFAFGGFSYTLEQFLLSPEFHDGWWHRWVHMNLTFCL